MSEENVKYKPGYLEFYQKMWEIDPEEAKIWIEKRLTALAIILNDIKNEMKQLREITNHGENKKALDYYYATNGDTVNGKKRTSYNHKNREIIINYLKENLDVAVRTKDIIGRFLSLGLKNVNVYNLVTEMVENGSIKRAGHGYLKLPESRISVDL